MSKYLLLILLLLGNMGYLTAQSLPDPQPAIQLGYSGELIFHPGFSLGFENAFKTWRKTKKKGKVIQKNFLWEGRMAMMFHPKTTSFTTLEGGINYRKLRPSGITTQYSVRLGGLFRENTGTTYIEQPDGSIQGFKFAGRTYALMSLGWGLGYDLRVKKDIPLAINLQPQIGLLFPYNYSSLPFTRLELGVRYYLNSTSKP